MLRRKFQRWNNSIHRDLGYLFFGMTIIYSISGIILNHFKSGDLKHPDYSKSYWEFSVPLPVSGVADMTYISKVLDEAGEAGHYKSHIFSGNSLQIYLTTGSINVDLRTGSVFQEKKKPLYVTPRLLGRPAEESLKAVDRMGLQHRLITRPAATGSTPGRERIVVAQRPQPGYPIAADGTVELEVSK